MKTIFLTLLMSANLFAFTALTSEGGFKLNRSSKLFRDLSVGTQVSGGNWMRAIWDFKIQGGATGDKVLVDAEGQPAKLPANAIVYDCLMDVDTPVIAGAITSTTISVSSNAVADLKAATNGHTGLFDAKGRIACTPTGTAATAVKMTSEAVLKLRVNSEALTGGRINVYVNYVISG